MAVEAIGAVGAVKGIGAADLLGTQATSKTADVDGKSFGQFLTDAIGDVNALQMNAGDTVQKFATGAPMDVHEVMIAMEKASTAMALTTQVRNKLVDAYQELMHTQM